MHSYTWATFLLAALTVTAAPAPQSSNQQPSSTLPVDLGSNVTFPDFSPIPTDPSNPPSVIQIPVSSSTYNLVFSKFSNVTQPPAQNFPAALLFIQRLFKDRFFNVPQASITSTIADPVIDVKTAGVWLHVENLSKSLRYNVLNDVLAYIAYFSLTWRKERTLIQLVDRTTNQNVYTGWVAVAGEDYASQFP